MSAATKRVRFAAALILAASTIVGSSGSAAGAASPPRVASAAVRRRRTVPAAGRRSSSRSSASSVLHNLPRGGGGGGSSSEKSSAPVAERPISVPTGATTDGTASMPAEIFNLVKSIVGAGVLGLPAGIAAFGDAPSALLPAAALVGFVGLVSGYGFSLIGRVCAYTGARSYREAWERTVGPSTSWMPALACTSVTTCSILAYSMILADTFQNLYASAGYAVSRSHSLFSVTLPVLLPLCLLKNMSSLAPFSLLGIMGMAYTSLAMMRRYLDGSYALPDGPLLADLAPHHMPQFGSAGASAVLSPNTFILMSMLCTAYMAHYNASKFYVELKDNTLKRFNTVVGSSFALSVVIFAAVAGLGFLTFGKSSAGLVLNNYSSSDPIMSLSRLAVASSIVFSYPLAFVGVRDGLLDLAGVPENERTEGRLNALTVAIFAGIAALALSLKDLSFVLSFGGSTWGAALIYVFPALMFRAAVRKMGDGGAADGLRAEVRLAMGKACLGTVLGCIGTKMALKKL
mmetsp:Transcript_4755/g.13439  ORF Transcript_4755/g.13439 Transcript_4755/m.13439 type:complete len:516 (-) Transcript_4755:612-2159(-)